MIEYPRMSSTCKFYHETITNLEPSDNNLSVFNLVTLNAGYEINQDCDQKKLLKFLMQGDPPQVVCLQEMRTAR